VKRLALVLALLAACAAPAARASQVDRRFVVLRLQSLSDHVGFGATFALGATDDTLVMSGSDLCGPDFGELIPPAWWQEVVDTDFAWFECSAPGVTARVRVSRSPTVAAN
jgi:hypothetical protein